MELLYEKVLDNLLINQDKLTKTERLKLFVTLSGYLFTKNKPVVNKQTEESLSLKFKDLISFTSEDDTEK
jgi:tRNA splicing endonuclease